MIDPRKFGYKRLETDEEFRARILEKWTHKWTHKDNYREEVRHATKEKLDELGWRLALLQRRIIDVY